ncbi:hypothetical protein ScPMuIL_003596 [Solemya velum]
MDYNWTPGHKKNVKASNELDDLLGDLLDEDVSPPKKNAPPSAVGRDRPQSRKQSPKDDNFYSNLAAMADDDLSDVSEADVKQVAKSIADLDDMDADLFGGKVGKKNSLKRETSGKGTPRRAGTPRSRSTTPRAISPHARVASPVGRVVSPVGRASTPTRSETPTGVGSRPGSGKRRTGAKTPPPTDYKPGTAPGKLSDISSASENLKPGQVKTADRPETAPKLKPKYDFGEFDANDPLAGLLSSDDESDGSPPAKGVRKPALKHKSSKEDLLSPRRKKNFFDRPPTRSGSSRSGDNEDTNSRTALKKKEESIFSDDDEFLGGLGIDDNMSAKSPQAKPTEIEEEEKPARSIMDQLLSKDSVTIHLAPKERPAFVLDQKYSANEPPEENIMFGGYQPSQASGSRPSSRRSVRFQDEDDNFGFEKSQPKSSSFNNPERQTTPNKDIFQTSSKSSASKPKFDQSDWLGLKSSEEENEEFEWLKSKTAETATRAQQKSLSSKSDQSDRTASTKIANEKKSEGLESSKSLSAEPSQKSDWLFGGSDLATKDDYLGLGQEIDPGSILRTKPESPTFGGSRGTTDQADDLFSPPTRKETGASFWQSANRPRSAETSQPSTLLSKPPDLTEREQLSSTVDAHSAPTGESEFFQNNDKQRIASVLHGRRSSQDRILSDPAPKPPLPSTLQQDYNPPQAVPTTIPPNYPQLQVPPTSLPPPVSQQELLQQHQQFIQQQQQLQRMVEDMRLQYQVGVQSQTPGAVASLQMPTGHATTMQMPSADVQNSMMELQTKVWKLEMEQKHNQAMLESAQKRFADEIQAIEDSYKSRIKILEDTHQKREMSWRDEKDQMLSQHCVRITELQDERSKLLSQHYEKIEKMESERSTEMDKIKALQRKALDDLRKDYDDSIQRLKLAKDQQIDVVASSHDTTRSLHAAVQLIQTNSLDLGELQKKMDGFHSLGLDDREISIRAKDEQLKLLGERLSKQQNENNRERKRLEELIARMESELREQTRMMDEDRWKVKQEHCRLESLQTSLEEERKLFNEQQARERANIDKTRDSYLEEQKSILDQLHREQQTLARERVAFETKQRILREDNDHYNMKNTQAKVEYEAFMATISEEKTKQIARKEALQKEVEGLEEEKRRIDTEMAKLHAKEEELIETVNLLKDRSEEVDAIYMASQQKFEEGMVALETAEQYHAHKTQREMAIQNEIQSLRAKDKEILEERLKLSKDKKEMENLKSKMLCANCRLPVNSPVIDNRMLAIQQQQVLVPNQGPMAVASPRLIDNSVVNVTQSIKADRTIRMWKMEAAKDQKYLEEESMFLYSLKHTPYSNSTIPS